MKQIPKSSTESKLSLHLKIPKKWLVYGALGVLSLILVLTLGSTIGHPIERGISIVENLYQQWFDRQDTTNPLVLLPLAFIGGVLASVSPCILALLPVNLSYIGTLKIKSRRDAFIKAGFFVLGSVTILSLFGLVSSFAGAA
jgi:cytochrome c-type biogenesis protein